MICLVLSGHATMLISIDSRKHICTWSIGHFELTQRDLRDCNQLRWRCSHGGTSAAAQWQRQCLCQWCTDSVALPHPV